MELIPYVAAVVIFAAIFFIFYRPRRCNHDLIICLHGDEAIDLRGRSQCVGCDKVFKELPDECSYTGESHRLDMSR